MDHLVAALHRGADRVWIGHVTNGHLYPQRFQKSGIATGPGQGAQLIPLPGQMFT
jgi:hypothetical protein